MESSEETGSRCRIRYLISASSTMFGSCILTSVLEVSEIYGTSIEGSSRVSGPFILLTWRETSRGRCGMKDEVNCKLNCGGDQRHRQMREMM